VEVEGSADIVGRQAADLELGAQAFVSRDDIDPQEAEDGKPAETADDRKAEDSDDAMKGVPDVKSGEKDGVNDGGEAAMEAKRAADLEEKKAIDKSLKELEKSVERQISKEEEEALAKAQASAEASDEEKPVLQPLQLSSAKNVKITDPNLPNLPISKVIDRDLAAFAVQNQVAVTIPQTFYPEFEYPWISTCSRLVMDDSPVAGVRLLFTAYGGPDDTLSEEDRAYLADQTYIDVPVSPVLLPKGAPLVQGGRVFMKGISLRELLTSDYGNVTMEQVLKLSADRLQGAAIPDPKYEESLDDSSSDSA
jgi:hypothetical protein